MIKHSSKIAKHTGAFQEDWPALHSNEDWLVFHARYVIIIFLTFPPSNTHQYPGHWLPIKRQTEAISRQLQTPEPDGDNGEISNNKF